MRDSRWPGRGMRPRLTLSNIQLNPRLKDRGWLTEFVELCDTLIPWPALFVERVQNPKLPTFLRRKGFIELQHANSIVRPRRGEHAMADRMARR